MADVEAVRRVPAGDLHGLREHGDARDPRRDRQADPHALTPHRDHLHAVRVEHPLRLTLPVDQHGPRLRGRDGQHDPAFDPHGCSVRAPPRSEPMQLGFGAWSAVRRSRRAWRPRPAPSPRAEPPRRRASRRKPASPGTDRARSSTPGPRRDCRGLRRWARSSTGASSPDSSTRTCISPSSGGAPTSSRRGCAASPTPSCTAWTAGSSGRAGSCGRHPTTPSWRSADRSSPRCSRTAPPRSS